MARSPAKRAIRCYLCSHGFEVSPRTLSVPCPKCNRAIKVEDVLVKSYVPVNELQTCGDITIAKNGRVVAKLIQAGGDISCNGVVEGAIEADGHFEITAKASWKGKALHSRTMTIEDGAKLQGYVKVPSEPKASA